MVIWILGQSREAATGGLLQSGKWGWEIGSGRGEGSKNPQVDYLFPLQEQPWVPREYLLELESGI